MNPISSDLKHCTECAGRGCESNGDTRLKVQYIDKFGYFCDSCAEDLLQLGLVLRENGGLDVGTQLRDVTETKELPQSDSRVDRSNHSIADRPIKTSGDPDR
jgi:hypothetical protein